MSMGVRVCVCACKCECVSVQPGATFYDIRHFFLVRPSVKKKKEPKIF